MPEECGTIVHEWFEQVWNQGRAEAIDQLLAEDAFVHGLENPDGSQMLGPAGFKPLHSAFRQAFPDMRIEIQECIQDGDRIAFRCVVRGTHTGDGIGIEASGRPVEFVGMGFVHVRDGKIAEAWNSFDFQTMTKQIGTQS